MKRMVAGLVGLVLLGGASTANADIIVATFAGTVTSISDPSGGSFTSGMHPGAPFIANILYDANASPFDTSGNSYAAYPYLSSSFIVGQRVFGPDVLNHPGNNHIIIANDNFDSDAFIVNGTLDANHYDEGSNYTITLLDQTQSAFSSTQLPATLNIAAFQEASFGLIVKPVSQEGVPFASVFGSVQSVNVLRIPTVPAPEPNSLVLAVAAGVGLLGMAARRRLRVVSHAGQG